MADHHDMKTTTQEESEIEEDAVLSQNTPIRLGMIGGLIGFVIVLISAAWYLSSALSKIETKLDTIANQLTIATTTASTLEKRQSEHEREDQKEWTNAKAKLQVLDETGGKKVIELEKMVDELRNDFRVHTATAK